MIRTTLILLVLTPAKAGAFDLALPVACTLGQDCFIQQYMDLDTGPGAADFTCGPLSYDGHSGTDFAVPSLAAMASGVDVLASAPGVVKGVRDDMPDIRVSDPAAPPLDGKDCGNGLVIAHEGGWETQYCHMKRGSLQVAPGDKVTTGQVLGEVGLSGNTEFPHVHLSVRRNGAAVDPFQPDAANSCEAPDGPPLWSIEVPYTPGGIIALGLATDVPEFAAIKAGLPEATLTTAAPALVLWSYYFGNRAGDELSLSLYGPAGEIFSRTVVLERTQAQAFRATGKRAPAEPWPSGRYTGEATLTRDGAVIDKAVFVTLLY